MSQQNRRAFLGSVGQGMLVAGVGTSLAQAMDLAPGLGDSAWDQPGLFPSGLGTSEGREIERLAGVMRDTPVAKLNKKLVAELRDGTKLETLVGAGALCNARAFGGRDYEGYHVFMALEPAYAMSKHLPKKLAPLPVLKVLHRNARRMQRVGKRTKMPAMDLAEFTKGDAPESIGKAGLALRERMRAQDMRGSEKLFAQLCKDVGYERAYAALQPLVNDDINVHRIVLQWRAWDMLRFAGKDHAHAMLRQSLRYCVDEEQILHRRNKPIPRLRAVLPKLLDQHGLLGKKLGTRKPDDAWVRKFAQLVLWKNRETAADAVAAALAEGIDSNSIGEALSIASTELILHDPGDPRRRNGVHGASVGVHASDAANAWRHVARVQPHAQRVASLVVAGYHTAGQSGRVNKQPIGFEAKSKAMRRDGAVDASASKGGDARSPEALLRTAERAITKRDQLGACAAIHAYAECGGAPKAAFDMMLRYAISEDGALHAEKYYKTAHEEYHSTRPAFRMRQLVALARVTASEFGEPAPGVREARKLLEA